MTQQVPSLLQGFSITKWYKFALYIAGVTLILSLFLNAQIPLSKILNFSIITIIIGLIIWFIDDYIRYRAELLNEFHREEEENLANAHFVINLFGLIIWIIVIITTLLW